MSLAPARFAAVLCGVVLTACVESIPSAPVSAIRSPSGRVVMGAKRPTLIKNHVKYSDAGKKPASASAGDASLTAQALLGSDGMTTLDVTASATLARVQVKQFALNGAVLQVSNYTALTGSTARFVLPGSARGSRVEVRANIAAADGSRTEVVTVTETVKFRPDVAVVEMFLEPRSVRGGLTIIGATYQELRGDVGARANCVLTVNGVAVDQAREIWVDAGTIAGCQFLYRFPENGVHQVRVSAEGVDPGDYDLANNSRSGTITIVDPAPVPASNQFSWDANVFGDSNMRGTFFSEGWAQNSATGANEEHRIFTEWKGQDRLIIDISGQSPVSFRGPIDVRFMDRVDGTVLHDDRFDVATDQRSLFEAGFFRQDCALLFRTQEVSGEAEPFLMYNGQLIVCSSRDVEPINRDFGTWFTYFAQGGRALYFTDNFWRSFGPEFNNTYAFIGDVDYTFGTYAFGSEFAFEITFSDATRSLTASGAIPIWASDVHELSPLTCTDYKFEAWTVHNCNQFDYTLRRFRAIGVAPVTP